jgi:hypothetical protein
MVTSHPIGPECRFASCPCGTGWLSSSAVHRAWADEASCEAAARTLAAKFKDNFAAYAAEAGLAASLLIQKPNI